MTVYKTIQHERYIPPAKKVLVQVTRDRFLVLLMFNDPVNNF